MPDPRKRYELVRDSEAALVGPQNIIASRPPEYREVSDFVIPPEAPASLEAAEEHTAAQKPLQRMKAGARRRPAPVDIEAALRSLDENVGRSLDPRRF